MSKITVAFPFLSFLGRADFGEPIKKLKLTFHKLIVMLCFGFFFLFAYLEYVWLSGKYTENLTQPAKQHLN